MAIALPYLDSMSWGKTKDTGALPKRLVVSYMPTVSMSREQRMDHTMIGTGGHVKILAH